MPPAKGDYLMRPKDTLTTGPECLIVVKFNPESKGNGNPELIKMYYETWLEEKEVWVCENNQQLLAFVLLIKKWARTDIALSKELNEALIEGSIDNQREFNLKQKKDESSI